ncbi:MAG: two-component sensor histidine kinase, partial [Planctomycetes bacterium]|nr:two-component sensor histidine kinase [Planctomycetota bacterium]
MISEGSSDSVADWGALLGGLAHELKNPLSTINLNLQLMREDPDLQSGPRAQRLTRKLDVLLQEVGRLERMLADFQRLVSNAELDRKAQDINALVDSLLEFEAGDFRRRNVTLTGQRDQDLPQLLVDGNLFRQALLNVIKNALEAIEGGGTLTVNTLRRGDRAIIEVIDTGPGMTPETLRLAFNVYFSTKGHGTGLGLPMVKRILERHGGLVRADSKLGVGTRL